MMALFGYRDPTPGEIARDTYIKRKLTEALSSALRHLEHKYVNSEEPIYSEDSANSVCNVIEAIFMHCLKTQSSVTSKVSTFLIGPEVGKVPQPVFWDLLKRISHNDVVSQLNHFGQITTEIGMCRAWIRIALNDGLLESYLDALLQDRSIIRKYYKQTAYLRDMEQADIMKTYIQCLQAFTFQLSYNSSVLNIWTTTPLVLAGIMEPMMTPRAVNATVSHEAISGTSVSPVSSAKPLEGATASGSTATSGSTTDIKVIRNRRGKGRNRMVSDMEYSRNSPDGIPVTPPNTPYNSGMLTSVDIDNIRHMSHKQYQQGSTMSTPPSQISIPDPAVRDAASSDSDSASETNDEISSKADAEPIALETGGKMDASETVETVASKTNDEKCASGKETEDAVPQENTASEPVDSEISAETGNFRITTKPLADEDGSAEAPKTKDELSLSVEAQAAGRSSSPAFLHIRRKSEVLEPEESTVTATDHTYDELAQEASASNPASYNEKTFEFEASIYDMYRAPAPQSNSLGSGIGQMRGWSSDFEGQRALAGLASVKADDVVWLDQDVETSQDVADDDDEAENATAAVRPKSLAQPIRLKPNDNLSDTSGQSYDELVQAYAPTAGQIDTPHMSDVLESLDSVGEESSYSPTRNLPDTSTEEYPNDFEIVTVGPSCSEDFVKTRLTSVIGTIAHENGLDSQNFTCRACSRPIGIIYGKPRICTYDACYYCFECHENDEYYIPSRIIYNWNFGKFKVCKLSLDFLREVEDLPMINIQQLNPRLYEHVDEMKEALDVRVQLRYLKAYLFTCKQTVAEGLRKQVWPKEYLYEDVHLYSLNDLLQIQMHSFCGTVRKLVKYASKHVYDCRLCSQKGFICEICQNPKVIYPFEMETTSECEECKSVYHKQCKPAGRQCPKCKRLRRRSLPSDPSAMDYAVLPDT